MRLISHVIYLLFLGALHGVRYLVVAILQTPAKANKEHPVNTMLEESSLCCIFTCARPSEIVISVQLLGLLVLTKHSGSLCFMCLTVLVRSGCPGKIRPAPPGPPPPAWKFCVPSSHCCHVLTNSQSTQLELSALFFKRKMKAEMKELHITCLVFAHVLI